MARYKRVALLIGIDFAHGRGLLRGVYHYARPHRPWMIHAAYPSDFSIRETIAWKPDGIIAHVYRQDLAEALRNSGVPVVCVSNTIPDTGFPTVHIDDDDAGRMAAEFFLQRRFRSFAYLGLTDNLASRQRQEGFERALHEAGMALASRNLQQDPAAIHHQFSDLVEDLRRWLQGLPRPVALLGHNDGLGLLVADTCLQCGLHVPHDVAILGIDNDELTCNRAFPPLSSIATSNERMGFEAARMLDRMMRGAPGRKRPITFAPVNVVQRQSTDVLHVPDPEVAAALSYIRQNLAEGLSVDDVAEAAGVSRRVLEKRFRRLLQRSPFDEIQAARIERAKDLLAQTELSVPAVAQESGFSSAQQLWRHFRGITGLRPMEYRNRSRLRD